MIPNSDQKSGTRCSCLPFLRPCLRDCLRVATPFFVSLPMDTAGDGSAPNGVCVCVQYMYHKDVFRHRLCAAAIPFLLCRCLPGARRRKRRIHQVPGATGARNPRVMVSGAYFCMATAKCGEHAWCSSAQQYECLWATISDT